MANYGISEAQFRTYLEDKVLAGKSLLRPGEIDLEGAVAQIILDDGSDDLRCYVDDLLSHGCQSGHVSPLVWFSQTEAFFIEHVLEITELVKELADSGVMEGFHERDHGNLANDYAWLAMEEITYRFASEAGLDL